MHVVGHLFFLWARKFEGHVGVIRVLVVMHVHPVRTREYCHLYSVEFGGDLPWPERLCVLNSEQRSWVESVVKEAAKGGETAAGTIVEKLMGERHLVDDNGGEVVSTRVLCAGAQKY